MPHLQEQLAHVNWRIELDFRSEHAVEAGPVDGELVRVRAEDFGRGGNNAASKNTTHAKYRAPKREPM